MNPAFKLLVVILCLLLFSGRNLLGNTSNGSSNVSRLSIQKQKYTILHNDDKLPFASQVTKPNTVYEIRNDFDLGGNRVIIPEGCVLKFSGGKLFNGTLLGQGTIVQAEPMHIFEDDISLIGDWITREVYSEWFGAVGDGKKDDSKPIQKALDFASIGSGLKVCLFAKHYLVNNQLDVPDNVELFGVYSKNDVSLDKASVIKVTSTVVNEGTDGILRLGGSVYVHDVKFWYPNQKGYDSEKTVTVYAPSILVKKKSDYVTIERIAFAGSYVGIRAEFHKNLTISECVGFCFKYGIYDIASHDIDRINDCHFNFNYLWQNPQYAKEHPWPKGAYNLYRYTFQNESTAFRIGKCDWIVLNNCFAYGYNTGFDIGSSSEGNYNLNIVGGGSDGCKRGVNLVNCHYAHITDLTVSHGDVWGSGEAVNIQDRSGVGINLRDCEEIKMENITHQFAKGTTLMINNSVRVLVSNCNYRATGFNNQDDWGIKVLGKSSFSFLNCVFSGWGTHVKGIEGGGLGCLAIIYDKDGSITGRVANCQFDNCTTLCNIEGGGNVASSTHYLLQSSNSFHNLLSRQSMIRMRNADINYGSTAKRNHLTVSGVWNNRADGEYWDTDLRRSVYWNLEKGCWVDANGNKI